MNLVMISGRLGRDCETNHTTSGKAVTEFSLATNRRVKNGDKWETTADWHNVKIWEREGLAPYLTKGKEVSVQGRIQTRSYENKDGATVYRTEIIAFEIELHGGSEAGGKKREEAPTVSDDDQVPF